MKKITLLVAAFLFAATATFAQSTTQTTSFETSEGYQLGTINGQNGWAVDTSSHESMFVVTDAQASDGTNSLQLASGSEPALAGYSTASVDSTGVKTISLDFYVGSTAANPTNAIMRFRVGTGLGFPGSIVGIANDTIYVGVIGIDLGLNQVAGFFLFGDKMAIPSFDGWNTLEAKVDLDAQTISYSVNGQSLIADAPYGVLVLQNGAQQGIQPTNKITNFSFVNFGGRDHQYIDNITYGDDMGVEDVEMLSFSHYVNQGQLHLNSQSQIGQVAIYNLLGQQVSTQNVNATSGSVSLAGLSTGVYIAKVAVNGHSKSFKFVKK